MSIYCYIYIFISIAFIIYLLLMARNSYNMSEFYLKKWADWESEYWHLRQSDAVNKEDYGVRLSWLPRGKENCINKINNQSNPSISQS